MKKRSLGIDFGLARIGLALSDPMGVIASPLGFLKNQGQTQKVMDELKQLVEKHQIGEFVIGMPLNLDGSLGLSAKNVQTFIKALKTNFSLPIISRDERLTTKQTERAMKEGNISRKKRTNLIDAACAALILQNYLDQKNLAGSLAHEELLAHEV